MEKIPGPGDEKKPSRFNKTVRAALAGTTLLGAVTTGEAPITSESFIKTAEAAEQSDMRRRIDAVQQIVATETKHMDVIRGAKVGLSNVENLRDDLKSVPQALRWGFNSQSSLNIGIYATRETAQQLAADSSLNSQGEIYRLHTRKKHWNMNHYSNCSMK